MSMLPADAHKRLEWPEQESFGTLYVQTVDKWGNVRGLMSRTSLDHDADMQTINAALELRDAIKLRDVHITPHALYQHIVGKTYEAPCQIQGSAKQQLEDRYGVMTIDRLRREHNLSLWAVQAWFGNRFARRFLPNSELAPWQLFEFESMLSALLKRVRVTDFGSSEDFQRAIDNEIGADPYFDQAYTKYPPIKL